MISTNGMPPTRQQVQSRIAKLDEDIRSLDALTEERRLLMDYLAILDRIAPVPGQQPAASEDRPPAASGNDSGSHRYKLQPYISNPTRDTAYEVLKRSGPLHL